MIAPVHQQVKRTLSLIVCGMAVATLSACGTQGVQLSQSNPNYEGAVLFASRCAGCHTLTPAGTEGSADSIKYRLRTNGPNLNQRKETVESVLYAIRNGGFSAAIMPADIFTGKQAEQVAHFVAKYAGEKAKAPPTFAAAPSQPSGGQSSGGQSRPSSGPAAAAPGGAAGGSPGGAGQRPRRAGPQPGIASQ